MIVEFDGFYIDEIKSSDAWSICDLMLYNEDRFKSYFPGTLAENNTPELSQLFADKKVKQFQDNEEYLFTIKVKETGKVVALIYIKELDLKIKQGEFAYCLDYNYKGQKVMSKVVRILSDYAFAELGLETLQIIAHKDNVPSVNVAINNNFTWQKTLLNEFTPPNSAPLDMELYEKYKA